MKEEQKKDDNNKIGNNEIEELKKQIEEAKMRCEEYLAGWKRERADFLNYKKGESERIGCFVKYANEELILKILPILDNIYLAESHVPESFGTAHDKELKESPSTSSGQTFPVGKVWIEGFLQIKKQFSDFLQKEGIEHIEVLGKEFNPNLMESASETDRAPSSIENQDESNVVVEEVQRGYTLHNKVIRPAKVKVTK